MNIVLICGGEIEDSFALSFLDRIKPEYIIGIDRGLEFCYKYNIVPQYILGDFDSISPEVLSYYESRDIPLERYKPEKDATDTRIGLELALKLKSRKIFLLGATGGCQPWILDSQNAITLLDRGTKITKDQQFGKYISFFSMGDRVEGVTLKGFKYPLEDYTLLNSEEIGISNELEDETGEITFRSGVVLMIMSKDRN